MDVYDCLDAGVEVVDGGVGEGFTAGFCGTAGAEGKCFVVPVVYLCIVVRVQTGEVSGLGACDDEAFLTDSVADVAVAYLLFFSDESECEEAFSDRFDLFPEIFVQRCCGCKVKVVFDYTVGHRRSLKTVSISCWSALQMPRSVISPVMSLAGVTSKP